MQTENKEWVVWCDHRVAVDDDTDREYRCYSVTNISEVRSLTSTFAHLHFMLKLKFCVASCVWSVRLQLCNLKICTFLEGKKK